MDTGEVFAWIIFMIVITVLFFAAFGQSNITEETIEEYMENIMKKISLEKVVLNMGVGKSGEPLETARKGLEQIIDKKPNLRNANKALRDWGVRKGEPSGVAVTVRGTRANELLKKLLISKDHKISSRSFDSTGNFSF